MHAHAMYAIHAWGSRKLSISLSIKDAVPSPAVRGHNSKQLRYADIHIVSTSTFVLLWSLGVPILDGKLILCVEFRK